MSAQAGSRPRSVSSAVRAAQAGLRAARALECALFFGAGVLLTLGAERLSGLQADAWNVALLCGALAAAAWWLEHPSRLVATARTLDGSLRHQGALALAFELEQTRAAHGLTAMEELVCARVRARLSVREAVRAVFPPLFLPLAAPAVAALFLLLVLDRRGGQEGPADDARSLVTGLERALPPGLEPEGADRAIGQAVDLRREAQELRARLQASAQSPPGSVERARAAEEARTLLERLDQQVARRLREPSASELRDRLDEARAWIDALRAALPVGAGSGAVAGGTSPGNLTGTPGDGTISRPMPGPGALPRDARVTSPTTTLGLQAGSFWPPEYDAIVERWVELSRAQAGNGR